MILTEDCNLRCAYCYQPAFAKTTMNADTALAALERAADAGVRPLSLTFFGGEPLLQAETMFEILAGVRDLERRRELTIPAKVSTNGLLLDRDIIERGARQGLFFSLSIDGDRRSQDAGRRTVGGGSSYPQAAQALELLVEGGRPFAVYSVVTPKNVDGFERSTRSLWERGARILLNTVDTTAHWSTESLESLRQEIIALGGFYRELLESRKHFHLEPFDSRIAHRTRPREFRRCQPGRSQLTVAPNGTLYGCVEYFHRRHHPLGTIDSWIESSSLNALGPETRALPEECRACALADRCNNRCDCANLRTTGRADSPSPTLCSTEQTTIGAVDTIARQLYRNKTSEFLVRQYSRSYHALSTIEQLLDETEASK